MDLWDLKYKVVDGRVVKLENEIECHEDRISSLEKVSSARDVQISNLVTSIESLVSWIKWGLAFLIPSSLGFFLWLLQQQLTR